MVDDALHAHFATALKNAKQWGNNSDDKLRELLSYADSDGFTDAKQIQTLIYAIDSVKTLDPACGSGAFPMGLLHKLVHVLSKLDKGNVEWKNRQIKRADALIANAEEFEDSTIHQNMVSELKKQKEDIEDAFKRNQLNYGRKLFLIKNCLYGVDLQPIAVQITKLRFFISLIVDEDIDAKRPNFGVQPLPNLETKFVAANTLFKLDKPDQKAQGALVLGSNFEAIKRIENELKSVRSKHFSARTQATKEKYRQQDKALREQLSALLIEDKYSAQSAQALADWNPYDLNASASFFDPHWMFETDTFDIVIGNPPYLRLQGMQATQPECVPYYKANYDSAKGNFDLYALFIEAGYKLLAPTGQLAYIVPHKFFQASFGRGLRELLAKQQALRQVARFGSVQVFDEASTYTCLLFLSQQSQPAFDLLEVHSLSDGQAVLDAARARSPHPDYAYEARPAPEAGASAWDFSIGAANQIMQRLKQHPQTLGDITRKIFVGLQTSADKIYVLAVDDGYSPHGEPSEVLRCKSAHLDEWVEIERGLTRPFLMGKDVHRYEPATPRCVVIFPYTLSDGKAHLMSRQEIASQYPKGWAYLQRNQTELAARERGIFEENWWCFSRPQNMTEFLLPKLMTPDICARPELTIDTSGGLYSCRL
jgi:adenine-specific DNA-methyltransferase